MNRNFNQWLSTFKDSIATWTYYTDFNKVYSNVDNIKVELNIQDLPDFLFCWDPSSGNGSYVFPEKKINCVQQKM